MAIRSGFFNSVNGDRKYSASHFAEYFASFIGNGVFPNPSNNLQVLSNDDMTVTVKAGKAWINGYILINDDDYILTLDPADGVLNRIDRIVARYDTVDREIRLEVKQGAYSSSPVAPSLQRDADAYELGLADVLVSNGVISINQANITDLRLNNELCGIVHGTVEQAHLAKNIGLEDIEGNFVATNIEGAMQELFTNVSNGKSLVGGAITDVDDSVVIPTDPTFSDLANAIGQISTGADISNISPGNIIIFKHSGFSSYSGTSTAYQKMCAYTIRFGGGIRLSFTMKTGSGTYGGDMYAQVYINDEPVGIKRSKTGNTEEKYTFTEDFDGLKEGDEISIYARKITSAVHIYVGEVEFKATTNVYII